MAPGGHSERQVEALELEVRQRLYFIIAGSPGLHYREIQRRSGIAAGQLTYHLDYLRDVHLIKTVNDGEYLRYYTNERINPDERRVLELVRQKSVRHLLLYLLNHDGCNHASLVEWLSLSPSTVSWHLKKLLDAGIISKHSEGRQSLYTVNMPETVKVVLVKYKESFLDTLVDRFIDMWDL